VILWCDGAHDAPENMRRDRALWERAERGGPGDVFEPVLRLFTFQPAGITLGHAQRPEDELDLERCAADRVAWAIRPTGGRAIFHAEEWTYALVARLDDPDWGGSPRSVYERIGRLLRDSLRALGVDAALARGGAPGSPRASGGAARPCFASTARLELVREGRKLAGSAQRRGARAFIQQGSVLLSDGHLRLVDYQRLPEDARPAARTALAAAAAHAGDVIDPHAPLERWAEAIERVTSARRCVAAFQEGALTA
jgi:lipoate-protein ligase A